MIALVLLLLAVVGAPLFVVISGTALTFFHSVGRPPADVTGEIGKLIQMDTLITIPLFTFAGYILAESNAPRRLVDVSRALFGWIPGGMAVVTLVTCAFFTTFTGASGITIVALGGLLLPILIEQGYDKKFSLGLITTSGSRGLVFPPSLPVIIYGYVAAVDITRLYIAGILPGIIDIAVVAVFCVKAGLSSNIPRTRFDGKRALRAVWKALPEVLLPVWLVGAIFGAILKVPEAAAMAALYALIVEVVIYRDVHPIRDLPRITKESMILCGVIMVILAASLGLTNYLVDRQIPQQIVGLISSAISNKWIFLLALNIFLLIVGCLMDIFSAIVIVVPLLIPLAAQFGVDPIHLAIIFLLNLELGYNTPPVGMNLFIASFRFGEPVLMLYRAALPFVLVNVITVAIVTYVQPISTFTVPQNGSMAPSNELEMLKRVEPNMPPGATDRPVVDGPVVDGLCDEKKPNDPDCDDIEIDDDP